MPTSRRRLNPRARRLRCLHRNRAAKRVVRSVPLWPPQSGHRRAEFSSNYPDKWSTVKSGKAIKHPVRHHDAALDVHTRLWRLASL